MARNFRIPLSLRFFSIVTVFLVAPTIAMTVIVNTRVQENYWSRVRETISFGQYSFSANLKLQQQQLEARAVAISKDSDIIELFERLSNRTQSRPMDAGLIALARQNDVGFTWFDEFRSKYVSIGRGEEDVNILSSLVADLGPRGPASRIMAGEHGLRIVTVTPLRRLERVVGWLLLQQLMEPTSIETLRLSIGQELTIFDRISGRQLFTTFSNAYGEPLRNEAQHLHSQSADPLVNETLFGKSYYSIQFPLPQDSAPGLLGEISIPSDKLLAADTAGTYAAIAVGIILCIIISSFLLTRTVISPILGLSYAVESFGHHVRDYAPLISIPIRGNDEIGDLARSVNELGGALRESSEKIQEQRAEIIAYTHTLEQRVQERTRELEEARRRAEIANEHKSRFLVNMNHELRTPLNSIAGITDLLRFGAYEKHEDMAPILAELAAEPTLESAVSAAAFVSGAAEALAHDGNGKRFVFQWLKARVVSHFGSQELIPQELSLKLDRIQALIDDEERQIFRAYNNIRDAGDSLLSIIDEVINLSRIESGVIIINRGPVRVEDLLNSCMVHAESYARSKRKFQNLEFSKTVEPEVPEAAIMDGQKVKQVFLNLLTNAVKYTESGYVHCRVGVRVDRGQPMLLFSVQDTGRGISDKDREVLFLEFGRAFEVREIEGTGLGLALSRKLIEKHGGNMDFSSELGKGSTFWFTIPLEPLGASAAENS